MIVIRINESWKRLLEKEHADLTGLAISIVRKEGSKRNYLYDVKILKQCAMFERPKFQDVFAYWALLLEKP
jgi:hypothetical protein